MRVLIHIIYIILCKKKNRGGSMEYELIAFDYSEQDNKKWKNFIQKAMETAQTFEIHCWNHETQEIGLAEKYGQLKEMDWEYGKVISGAVTEEFLGILLKLPKPTDIKTCNKMTPFFSIFFDNGFSSEHYGTENYISYVNM